MKKLKISVKALLTLLWLAISAGHAGAIDLSFRPNATEMLQLPPYCQIRFNKPQASPEWKAWRDQIGENYLDIHHYCAALNFVNRYWGARTKQERGFYLKNALNNFTYLVKAEKPDFALRTELYSNRGEVFKLMGRPGEAVKDFNHALSINPRVVKPYLQISDLHVAGKSPARALETVTEGLRYLPDSTALQRRYLELGGKKPFPEPVITKTPEPATPQTAEVTPEEVVEPIPDLASPPVSEPTVATEPQPPIGTPGNPYCRFCPPE
jgi:tetratricopeptide (TPR) repeat protein